MEFATTYHDLEPEFMVIKELCAPYTMTSVERMYMLWQAARHVVRREVPGAVVECGVWRGGSSMLAAQTLRDSGDTTREIYLFDTFEGMTAPSEHDIERLTGTPAAQHEDIANRRIESDTFAYASLDEVRRNMSTLGYPAGQIRYIRGPVEETLPGQAPDAISLLRLDTDWYASTRHELEHLWDRLQPGGVLIIDDYGHWAGARKAVDEFFALRADAPLLCRIDYTGRLAVKQ